MAPFVLSLAATLWAVMTPAPAAPQASAVATMASTYDEATCASLHAGDDDWAHAAIGEAVVEISPENCALTDSPQHAPIAKLDCDEPAPWPGLAIGSCTIPRANAQTAHLRAINDRAPRHTFRLSLQGDNTPPLTPPPTTRDAAPAHLSEVPALSLPTSITHVTHWFLPSLRSISRAPTPRPPAA